MSKKAKKRKYRRLSTSPSEDDEKTPAKTNEKSPKKYVPSKEKKEVRVHKTTGHSSSKDGAQGKRQIKKPVYRLEKTKTTRGHSPIFKEEKSKSKAKHSVPHGTEVSSKCKTSEDSSSKDVRVASYSQNKDPRDILIPRSISIGQKADEQHPPMKKKCRDVSPQSHSRKDRKSPQSQSRKDRDSPHSYSRKDRDSPHSHSRKDRDSPHPHSRKDRNSPHPHSRKDKDSPHSHSRKDKDSPHSHSRKDKDSPHSHSHKDSDLPHSHSRKDRESKKSSLVCEDLPAHNEPVKKKQYHQEQKCLEAKVESEIPAVSTSKGTTTATVFSKALPALQQIRETEKKCAIVPPQPASTTLNETVVAKKSALDCKSLLIKSDHKPASCKAKSSCNVEPSRWQMKIPSVVSYKNTTSALSTKATKALPEPQRNKCFTVPSQSPSKLPNFRIPKKADVLEISSAKDKDKSILVKSYHTSSTCEATSSVPQSSSSKTVSSNIDVQTHDSWTSFVSSVSPAFHGDPSPWQDQTMVVEQLHQARSEKLLEVNVMQSYGELTCMEIDPPDEGAADSQCKQLPQQDIIIALDTNILLCHLDYVKKIVSRGLEVVFPTVLIPWVVLQELDSLKKGQGLSGSVAHLAIPAISYIYKSLKGKESRLWGQSMQQAAESTNGLSAANNDDRVLQCCLQYQLLYPECAVILCTNDKNLCSKALLSGVKAFSKIDLETEVARSSQGGPFLQNLQAGISPQARCSISTVMPGQAEAQSQETTSLSVEKEINQPQKAKAARRSSTHLSGLVCQFERVLQEALSDVLEAEMKAAFGDLWLEIVYKKPPWSLSDVLQCLKKHWIAVFGLIVPRAKQQNVLNLTEFFTSGKSVDHNSVLVALLEAKDLLKEFVKSSGCVPRAISSVDNVLTAVQTQGETSGSDVVMKEAEEDKQPTSPPVSHVEVWALFGNIWQQVYQTSVEVFKAVDFDPKAFQSVRPMGGPPPPRDALACLHKLQCMVSQLLQAFSSFLTSTALAEAQNLLSVMQSTEIVNVDKVTATDLLSCFSQEEYRERLRTGGIQLLEVQAALNSCVEFAGGHVPFTVQP